MSVVLRDHSLSELHIQGKLERQASHSLLRSLMTAMERAFVDPISRGKLPPTVHVGALQSLDDIRVTLDSGSVVIANSETDEVVMTMATSLT